MFAFNPAADCEKALKSLHTDAYEHNEEEFLYKRSYLQHYLLMDPMLAEDMHWFTFLHDKNRALARLSGVACHHHLFVLRSVEQRELSAFFAESEQLPACCAMITELCTMG